LFLFVIKPREFAPWKINIEAQKPGGLEDDFPFSNE